MGGEEGWSDRGGKEREGWVCREFLNCSSPFCQEEARGGREGWEEREEREGG